MPDGRGRRSSGGRKVSSRISGQANQAPAATIGNAAAAIATLVPAVTAATATSDAPSTTVPAHALGYLAAGTRGSLATSRARLTASSNTGANWPRSLYARMPTPITASAPYSPIVPNEATTAAATPAATVRPIVASGRRPLGGDDSTD